MAERTAPGANAAKHRGVGPSAAGDPSRCAKKKREETEGEGRGGKEREKGKRGEKGGEENGEGKEGEDRGGKGGGGRE